MGSVKRRPANPINLTRLAPHVDTRRAALGADAPRAHGRPRYAPHGERHSSRLSIRKEDNGLPVRWHSVQLRRQIKLLKYRGPRKMVITGQAPQICPPMIPFCSRFDSVLFTPKMPAIAGCFNFSRSPIYIAAPSFFYAGVSTSLVTRAWRSTAALLRPSASVPGRANFQSSVASFHAIKPGSQDDSTLQCRGRQRTTGPRISLRFDPSQPFGHAHAELKHRRGRHAKKECAVKARNHSRVA
jgi:hypothetical protein